jgi:hypothetical protein
MTDYIVRVASTGRRSTLGPFQFEEQCFTDSAGHQVTAWGCHTSQCGRTNSRAKTRAHALAYWLAFRIQLSRAEVSG